MYKNPPSAGSQNRLVDGIAVMKRRQLGTSSIDLKHLFGVTCGNRTHRFFPFSRLQKVAKLATNIQLSWINQDVRTAHILLPSGSRI
jgi:hypothetical protein